tara:strand:+ start:349 stop:519 length:171 start_codon:yes stop_codon:yes gene_type:complete
MFNLFKKQTSAEDTFIECYVATRMAVTPVNVREMPKVVSTAKHYWQALQDAKGMAL